MADFRKWRLELNENSNTVGNKRVLDPPGYDASAGREMVRCKLCSTHLQGRCDQPLIHAADHPVWRQPERDTDLSAQKAGGDPVWAQLLKSRSHLQPVLSGPLS